MNKQLGLSHGKCVKLLGTLFEGLVIARGTSALIDCPHSPAVRAGLPAVAERHSRLAPDCARRDRLARRGSNGLVACVRGPTGNRVRD